MNGSTSRWFFIASKRMGVKLLTRTDTTVLWQLLSAIQLRLAWPAEDQAGGPVALDRVERWLAVNI